MKRYRILAFLDFDTRALALSEPIRDEWEENVKQLHRQRRDNTIARLKHEYGEREAEEKIKNFVDLGPKPMSVLAFHNAFFAQVRTAFVVGSYYPALTGACALGERILNHLMLTLRDDFKSTSEYKKVYRKDSFDDWSLAIDTLAAWDVLLPQTQANFQQLMEKRNRAIHFGPETDQNVRELALDAISCLQKIIGEQFSGFGSQPWFIADIPGEIYIKKGWESRPFIRVVYLRNGLRVSPRHKIESMHPKLQVVDFDLQSEGEDISDEEFSRLRLAFREGGQNG